jgi:hypothetical protein
VNGGATLRCLACQMPGPLPSMTCRPGRDHRVGTAAGCPGCGRTVAACARRPCSRRRHGVSEAENRPLEALDPAWGHVYDIWASGGRYLARRADGTGEPLTGDTPDDLIQAIQAGQAREGTL